MFESSFLNAKDRRDVANKTQENLRSDQGYVEMQAKIDELTRAFLDDPKNAGYLSFAKEKDPALAGKSPEEIRAELFTYPGIVAVAVHEKARALYATGDAEKKVEARHWSEAAHSRTGIDIHPGTKLGELCFIDHGTGDVMGETAKVGRGTVMYHNVTLGAYRSKDIHHRHPEIGDNCTISTGVQVLGHVVAGNEVTIGPDAKLLGDRIALGNAVKIGSSAQLESGNKPGEEITVADNVRIGANARIDGGNIIAKGIQIGARAVIPKGIGLIDSNIPDDVTVSRGDDKQLQFNTAVPGFADKLRAAASAAGTEWSYSI